MSVYDLVCPRCGWRNEAPARVCGGCGKPLPAPPPDDPGATQLAAATVGPASLPWEAPTVAAPLSPPAGRVTLAAKASAPGKERAWRRVALVAAVLAVVAAATLVAWAAFLRPAIHAQLDGELRSLLDNGVRRATAPLNDVPAGQAVPAVRITITAAELTDQIRSELPADSPVKDVRVGFARDRATITYSFLGRQGAVAADLALDGSRVVALNPSVDCPLCLVESAGELQSALDEALAQVPSTVPITALSADGDKLAITVG
jgi:hypothetical protein